MPVVSVSAMKQDAADEACLLDVVDHQPPSPASLCQQQFAMDNHRTSATPRRDVIGDMSRDDSSWQRATSGAVTSLYDNNTESRETFVDERLHSKLINSSTSASSALVSSPETGWRAISCSDVGGGSWNERPIAPTSVSSPADGEPADVSLVAASPTVGRTPLQTSDSGSKSCDPLATLMQLYGTLSNDGRKPSPDRQLSQFNHSPAPVTSLPVLNEFPTQGGTSGPINSDDYIMRELNEGDDDEDGPAKSYVCHVCQYIGTSRSMYLNHMSEHFRHRCTLCGYMTSYAGRLKRHLEDCHMTDNERPVSSQRKPTLKRCRKCGFESTNLKLFYDHVRTHIRPERILECPTTSCPFVTEYRHHLELHLRNHLNSRPIRCPICPYRCAVSSMLASHLKSHTKVHRFRCSVCRFSSKFSNALKRHLLEKGHGRGYVLNPDGSIPEGGAVPFEPGSPTTRLRQKVAKTAAATAGTSETQRKSTTSDDVMSDVSLVSDADIKAAIWTPPVAVSPELHSADGRKACWQPVGTGDELVVKRSPAIVDTSPVTVGQMVSTLPLPPVPALMASKSATASLKARSLYACSICAFDAGGYVELTQHMMTSHYSLMMSGPERQPGAAVTTPFKRRWPADNDEPGAICWAQPPKLPALELNSTARRLLSHSDNKRDFLQTAFPASSMSVFQQTASPLTWSSYRSLPPVSTAFGSLSTLRAELDAMWSSDGPSRVRADEKFTASNRDPQRDNRMKIARSDMVDNFSRKTAASPPNFSGVMNTHHQRTKPSPKDHLEHVSVPVSLTSGFPLDLSTKTSTLQCDQLLSSVQSEVKRSRRKGKAFKVDADRLNSGSRDEDLSDGNPVVTEMNGPWLTSENTDRVTGEPARSSAGSIHVLAGRESCFSDNRDNTQPTVPRHGEPRRPGFSSERSDRTSHRQTSTTSAAGSASTSTQYHECRHCGLGFRDGELFAMHMDFHGQSDPFTCNFCGAATENQVEFFLHVAHAPHNVRPVYVI